MSEQVFRFKQFEVHHDRCAMKVGTDGVLLGAWARVEGRRHILDIGTGTGLVALMAAQRNPEAQIVGVEIDEQAAAQAKENVAGSPFAQRIEIVEDDIREYVPAAPFDCVFCNPPFFTEDTLPLNASRALARHTALFSFSDLLAVANRLLANNGELHVILPYSTCNRFSANAFYEGLFVVRKCMVRTVERKPPKRMLLTLARSGEVATGTESLVLQDGQAGRSEAYRRLTGEFYLG